MNINEFVKFREKSPLIIAIDTEPRVNVDKLLEQANNYAAGIKLGLPYILKKGINEIKHLISKYQDNYFFIADIKLADIGFVGKLMIDLVKDMGFNAFIAHGFIGLRNALIEIKEKADEKDLFLFVIAAMSHPGAEEILNKNFMSIVKACRKININGYVAPATLPNYIKELRKLDPNAVIISPGVGTQGARVGDGISFGATFEIIGRRIILSEDPLATLRNLVSIYEDIR